MNSQNKDNSGPGINRREAIKRASLLLGAAVSSSTLLGCMAEGGAVGGKGSAWSPKFLPSSHTEVLSAATELILPRTDSPGALDVGVPQLIDTLYGKYMSADEQSSLLEGLGRLQDLGFPKASYDEQSNIMAALAASEEETDLRFLEQLRELTLVGYFTSEEVCRNVTRYDPVPGQFRSCVPIAEVGNVIMSEPR